ncbi:hypothetical protein Tel_01920 [Candidatus Tenderia electrophaga]|jgi:CRP-like cAMP-binding protein|uniref:Cyclic nucleotide-binding domain-containing protein n=1 Tax=Candidatus Tenderia electrophaga TaxID=1748243 RepID=A0A0S2TA29_9GAMM|nr:hypothetical protein Tel_01920 [Candidatus Tenderia electrophaga]
MKQAAQMISSTEVRKFAPLGKLSDADAQELLRTSISIQLSPGTPVFNQDDMDKQVFYLLKGKVELRGANHKTIIEGGSQEAYQPIGRHLPGQVSARALEESVLISFDADMLDLFLNWTNPNAYVVNEMDTGQDHAWMNRLLQSRGLLRFSESQINTLLERMNEVHVRAGQRVVTQDADDDFYYVIKEGRATVSRTPDAGARPIKLAELGAGDAFGEESLLTTSARAATVTMQQDGTLMRLSKQDFAELLAEPLLSAINWDEAQAMAATGGLFIDIRLQDEFKAMSIPGSVNIPMPVLRLKLKGLKHNRKYIVYCDDGSRSSVAAFLLNQHGFDAFILDGGLASAIPHLALREMNTPAAEETAQATTGDTADSAPANEPSQETDDAPVSQTKQGNTYCSLADYWGSTVDEVSDNSFADSAAVYQVEKTRVTQVLAQPAVVSETKPHAIKAKPPGNAAPHKQDTNAARATPARQRHGLRNTLIGATVIGLGALFASSPFSLDKLTQLAASQPPVNPTAVTPQTRVTPPITRPAATPRSAPMIADTPTSGAEPQRSSAEVTESDMLIESDIYLSMDGEILQLQPTTIMPHDVEAPVAPTAPKKAVIDPATRGFLN